MACARTASVARVSASVSYTHLDVYKRQTLALSLWPVLMACSRLYLGRHFLGDVLGGACLGLLAAAAAWWLWRRQTHRPVLSALALLAGIAACWSPLVDLEAAGQLLGLALLASLLARIGWPADEPTTPAKRLGRVALVFAVYLLGRFGSHAWLQHFGDCLLYTSRCV